MPLPRRRRHESERKFMGRCMGWMHRSGEAERRYPAEGQPAAVCYSQFRRRNGDVTFGRMDRSDPSQPEMSIMNDGVEVGFITADTVPDETTRIVTYVQSRVVGYSVNLFGDDGEDKHFEIKDGENPRSVLARAKRWAKEKLGPRANPHFVPSVAWTHVNPGDEIEKSLAWAREQIRLCRCDPRNSCLACVRAEAEIREAAARRNPGSPPLGGNAEFYREQWERERDPEWGLRYAHALDREGSYELAREVYDELAGVYEQAGSRGMRAIARTRAGELARRRNAYECQVHRCSACGRSMHSPWALCDGWSNPAEQVVHIMAIDWNDHDNVERAIRAVGEADPRGWKRVAVLFAADCLEHVLPAFGRDDDRPRRALNAARAWGKQPSAETARLASIASDAAHAGEGGEPYDTEWVIPRAAGSLAAAAAAANDFAAPAISAVGTILKGFPDEADWQRNRLAAYANREIPTMPNRSRRRYHH